MRSLLQHLATWPVEKETLIMPSNQAVNGIQVTENKGMFRI